jgi:hypothetical protein
MEARFLASARGRANVVHLWSKRGRSAELVEKRRRSIAMLPMGAPALNRDEAFELLAQLVESFAGLRAFERTHS